MSDQNLAYLPPKDGFYQPPLSRYLPPLPKTVISTWLGQHTNPGDLVIDPLGANPMLALEIAHSGRQILFARNNPVLWLMLEVLASAPTGAEIEAAISKLLLSRQDGLTLEEQLKSTYESTCFDCGESIQPEGFIWEENANAPSLKFYRCQACGTQGEKPVSPEDIQSIKRLGNIGLQRARAFQRAATGDDYEDESIKDALDCYSPRAIFTLMLLINRLDRMSLEKEERRLLQAILLSVFDDGSSLWHWPVRDHRHLQISVPSPFLEKNLFLSLEGAVKKWQSPFDTIQVTYYPQLPDSTGGICLYQRKLADQDDFLIGQKVQAAVSLAPRPNQAFWTLSALWSGWLWGKKGSTPMRGALARRRYDWHWFAQAISATMKPIFQKFSHSTPMFTVFPEASPNFYLGFSCGMRAAGVEMEGYAYRPSEELIQNLWKASTREEKESPPETRMLVQHYLETRGEPACFNELLIHVISSQTGQNTIPEEIGQIDEGLFRQIQDNLASQLRDEHFTIAYRTNQPGGSRWWLTDSREAQQPLPERVELFAVDYLRSVESVHPFEIEEQTCQAYKGILTPSSELINSVLESYTNISDTHNGNIQLRSEENHDARLADLREICGLLIRIGHSFGLKVNEPELGTVLWQDQQNKLQTRFFLKYSCDISKFVMENQDDQGSFSQVIVLPGSRSRLIAYRLREDPHLAAMLERNWHFLKFRHLRRLAARDNLTMDTWENLLNGDPMLWEAPKQTPLL